MEATYVLKSTNQEDFTRAHVAIVPPLALVGPTDIRPKERCSNQQNRIQSNVDLVNQDKVYNVLAKSKSIGEKVNQEHTTKPKT